MKTNESSAAPEEKRFVKGERVFHDNRRGETVESYFTRYCEDESKAVIDDGDGWNIGYEVVRISKLRRMP